MGGLAAYLITASFSQQRMDYLPGEATVIYHFKHCQGQKSYDAVKWIAAMGDSVTQRVEQSVCKLRLQGESLDYLNP